MNVPEDYVCSKCVATGCKLWRAYQSFDPALLCADCAAKDQDKDISDIDEKGCRRSDIAKKYGANHRTDQIGWYIPAVPTKENNGYWGYSSVPDDGVEWWTNLPTRSVK